VALDSRTGNLLWRTARHKSIHRDAGNCRTPAVRTVGDHPTIVVWGYEDLSGYDPASGRELWSHQVGKFGEMNNPVCSLISDDKRFYLVGARMTLALASDKLPGKALPVEWRSETSDGAQCASPVVVGGLLFAISDVGTAYCMDATTGETLWRQRLGKQHYASVVNIGDRIYYCNTRGLTTVVAAARQYRELAANGLGELTYASSAPVDGRLFIRTGKHLYCIAEGR
jgi:hypothetical protein